MGETFEQWCERTEQRALHQCRECGGIAEVRDDTDQEGQLFMWCPNCDDHPHLCG